jgi:excisionase family DNA binding protein
MQTLNSITAHETRRGTAEVSQSHPLLNTDEAARDLKLGKRTLAQLIAERKIGFIKIGRSVRFSREDLDAFVERQRVKPQGWKGQAR